MDPNMELKERKNCTQKHFAKKKRKKELLSTWKNARFVGKEKKPWALKMGPKKNTLSSNKGKS
jgi:hypothetical protein